jgi:hypothetical protein
MDRPPVFSDEAYRLATLMAIAWNGATWNGVEGGGWEKEPVAGALGFSLDLLEAAEAALWKRRSGSDGRIL